MRRLNYQVQIYDLYLWKWETVAKFTHRGDAFHYYVSFKAIEGEIGGVRVLHRGTQIHRKPLKHKLCSNCKAIYYPWQEEYRFVDKNCPNCLEKN